MKYMGQSTADPADYLGTSAVMDLPQWKAIVSGACAILLGILFIVSGGWKLSDPFFWSQLTTEFQVPSDISLPFAMAVGVGEMFGAAMIVIPSLRRWGSWMLSFLLISFIAYFAAKYNVLAGKDCSCFPLVKRTVG